MLRNGLKQLYGTQTLTIGTIIKIWPVDDPAGLDERRKAMGLQPMDEYLQAVKKHIVRRSTEINHLQWKRRNKRWLKNPNF
jgi:hypothetical protein